MAGRDSMARSNRSRFVQMEGGWRTFLRAPLGGAGVGQVQIPLVTRDGTETSYRSLRDPKNVGLHWLAERGIAGAVLFGLMAWSVAAALRRARPDPLAAACVGSWLALLGAGLVDTTFGDVLRYSGNCCFGILLGVTALISRSTTADRAPDIYHTTSACELTVTPWEDSRPDRLLRSAARSAACAQRAPRASSCAAPTAARKDGTIGSSAERGRATAPGTATMDTALGLSPKGE